MPQLKPVAIWRIDTASVRSNVREIAARIDQTVGNRDGKIDRGEIDAFVQPRENAVRGTDAFEEKRSAEHLAAYLASDESRSPLALDVAFRIARAPMTKFSDWLGRSIMGE